MNPDHRQLTLDGSEPPPPTPPPRPCPTCGGSGEAPAALSEAIAAPGKAGADHPLTSHQAAANRSRSIPRFGTQRHRVLRLLAERGPSTAAEIAEGLGISRNQIATRLGELREGGFVAYLRDVESGQRITRPTGPTDEGLVQILTAFGREQLSRIQPPRKTTT